MIFDRPPENFVSKFEIVSCFLESQGKFLLLHRQDSKPQGGMWGVPAGKVDEAGEYHLAIARELGEETGLALSPENFSYFGKVYVRYPDYDFVYHIFHARQDRKPDVVINPKEHKNYAWVSPADSLKMDLIQDLDACIKLFYDIK